MEVGWSVRSNPTRHIHLTLYQTITERTFTNGNQFQEIIEKSKVAEFYSRPIKELPEKRQVNANNGDYIFPLSKLINVCLSVRASETPLTQDTLSLHIRIFGIRMAPGMKICPSSGASTSNIGI